METFLFLWIFFIHWTSFNNNQPPKYRWLLHWWPRRLLHWWPRLSDIPTCRPDDRVRLLTSTMTTQLNATQRKYFSSSRLNQPSSIFEANVQDSFPTWSVHPTWSNLSTWFVISMWSFRHDIRFIDMILSNALSNCNSNGDSCKSGGNSNSNRVSIRFITQRYRFPKPGSVIGSTQPFKLSEWFNFLIFRRQRVLAKTW